MWRVGQKVGNYELVAHLRDGGMASLFLARRADAAGFVREVAIKLVHPELARDEQFRHMFLDEAMLASRIHHPNVVHVEELGEAHGAHFLVMEFVHGCSLSQLQRALMIRRRRLAPAFAVRIAMEVAEALHTAHATRDMSGRLLEVVHRDVSPENILLAYAGHVKLIDFGIAKAYGRRHRTQDGLIKGKFRYMTPEQAQGRKVDSRTDLYQLGIVLWEMLTLRRMFDAETDVALLAQVRAPQIVAPSTLVEGITPALDAAVLSALDANPARRPPDAQAFARLLGQAVPSAYQLDGGALSALVLGVMKDHRQKEQVTFPPEVYARLERPVLTLRASGDRESGFGTLEHAAAPAVEASEFEREQHLDPPNGERAATATQLEFAGVAAAGGHERGRRWVQLALERLQELSTGISEVTGRFWNRGGSWAVLGAVALAVAALAWLTVTWHMESERPARARVPVPALPAPSFAQPSAVPSPRRDPLPDPLPEGEGTAKVALPAGEGNVKVALPESEAVVKAALPQIEEAATAHDPGPVVLTPVAPRPTEWDEPVIPQKVSP